MIIIILYIFPCQKSVTVDIEAAINAIINSASITIALSIVIASVTNSDKVIAKFIPYFSIFIITAIKFAVNLIFIYIR